MTEEEFARLFPNAKWPRTFEGRHGTQMVPSKPATPPGFSDPSILDDAPLRGSTGLVRGRAPTPRERLFDLINRNLYGDGGVGTEANRHSKTLTDLLDFTPIGALHQAYDTGTAIGEGRLSDAAQSSGLAYLPIMRKSPINGLFNPKPKPQRPFTQDYPSGAGINEYGDLERDIEGRPLQAPYVAGRIRPGEPDRALMPIDIQRVGEHATQADLDMVPSGRLSAGNVAETHLRYGRPSQIRVLDSLPKEKMDMAAAHEVGHVIDALSNRIPVEGLQDELDFNYNALRTGEERKHILSRPQDFGYEGETADREKVAEAIRAYMVDPNYLKTVAPKTAARIRQFVADSPELRNVIQFNSLAAAGVLAGAAAGQSGDAKADGPPKNTSAPDVSKLVEALLRRGPAPRPPRPGFDRLVQALLEREGPLGSRTFGGPR